MIPLAALAVFSALSLNLLFSFALGTGGILKSCENREKNKLPLYQNIVLFFSVLFLWLIVNYIFPFFLGGFFEFFLLFPLCALSCMGLEFLGETFLINKINPALKGINKIHNAYTAYEGLVPIALFICLKLAFNFTGAFVLSFFFALGNLAAMQILFELSRRSSMERVPRFLRGSPLIIISMGLLSLIFFSVAGILLKILDVI